MLVQEQLIDQETMDGCLNALGEHKVTVIESFMQQAEGFVADIFKYSTEEDSSKVVMAAHSLKGASLQLGFHQLGMASKIIEDSVKKSETGFPDLDAFNAQLKLSYDATLSYIRDKLL